ncbi:MAG: TolC family protein, partial [Candidatus Melainabacteria bacterium]|nr:TolC family protein [Candidatus Melainabacteria bacterium]
MATSLKLQNVVSQLGCLFVLLSHFWVGNSVWAANSQIEVRAQELALPDVIPLELPPANKLLPMGGKLPPIRLEASYTEPISLREALITALENNLAIGISKATLLNQRWLWISSLGKFLPNALMNYDQRILSGSTLVSGVIPVTFHNPNVSTSAGFQFFGFQGGRVLFGALTSKHNWLASKAGLKGSINDVLLQVTQFYYGLLRHQALLEIQSRAVEVSRAQVDLNKKLERAGTGTRF